jgi:hypothetical protein
VSLEGATRELAEHVADSELSAVLESVDEPVEGVLIKIGREGRIEMPGTPLTEPARVAVRRQRRGASDTGGAIRREFAFAGVT